MFRGIGCLALMAGMASCGGGGGSNGGGNSAMTPISVSITASAASVPVGAEVTIAWSTDADCDAGGGWSGSKSGKGTLTIGPLLQNTTFSLTCKATATTAANSASVNVTVTASNVPSPTANKVVANSLLTSLDYVQLGVTVADLTWDPLHSRLWVLTTGDSPVSPASLLEVDPLTGAASTVSLGSAADAVAVSGDGQYVYVGFAQGGLIRRFLAADMTSDISFSVGAAAIIGGIQVSPASAHTIAVLASDLDGDPTDLPGLVIVDDGIVRPDEFHGIMPVPATGVDTYISITDAHWSDDGSHINVTLAAYGSGIVTLAVTPQGVSAESQWPWGAAGPIDYVGDRIYSITGFVYSLSGPVQMLGKMPDALGFWNARTVSAISGKAFSLQPHLIGGNVEDGATLYSFDLDTFAYIDSVTFNGAAMFHGGKMIKWGSDGLAMGGESLLMAKGSFIAAGGVPPPAPDTAAILGSASLEGIDYRLLGITASDLVADSCGHLYAATDAAASPHPSSVMEIDFETGGILRAVHVGGEPYDLAVSDDCNTLYAALHSSNAVARVDLTTMSVNAIVPLNTASSWSQGYLRGRSIGVAPGHPHTVAIAKGDMDASLCGGSDYGVVIFDDLVARSVEYGQGPGYSVKSIVWSTGADVLYGEDWNSTYAFTVDGTGVHSPMALFPYRVGTAVYDLGRDLYFDKGTGRLYNSFGNVYDTLTSHELGPIKLVDTPAIINSCGTPSAARVTDSNSGKIFFVTGTNPVLGVAAYDKDSLSLLGHAVFSGTDTASGFSEPLRVVRPTTGGLAVVTASGQIVLMQGSLLSP